MKVYISSTLNDLRAERDAIKQVLVSVGCSIKESYKASESDLVDSILKDVAECDLYILVLGRRYGFIPPGESTSITTIEYEQAVKRGVPRFVFLKNRVAFEDTDSSTKENPPEQIEAFRKRVSSGGRDEPRPAQFETVEELKLAVQTAVYEYKMRRSGQTTPILGPRESHPWEIKYEMSVACVPGTDDELLRAIRASAVADQRICAFPLGPGRPNEYLETLDAQVRRSRSAAVAITSASLSRFAADADNVANAIDVVKRRCAGVFGLLVDVTPAELPPALKAAFDDVFTSSGADWSATGRAAIFDTLRQWRRARAPETTDVTRVGIPCMIIALTATEAAAMNTDTDALFKRFGDDADRRRKQFEALRMRLQQPVADASPDATAASSLWPDGFYGPTRADWRPFGGANATMAEVVATAADKINQSPVGSRERRLVGDARLFLQPYAFDEYHVNRSGSRANVMRVCELGCLVLLDEFALLHPMLRPAIDELLSASNVSVVSMSACDPTLNPLRTLLSDSSYLRIGNLHTRFSHQEDPRCELALNSIQRLQRWLRFVLPELKASLGSQQSDQSLVDRADEILAPR